MSVKETLMKCSKEENEDAAKYFELAKQMEYIDHRTAKLFLELGEQEKHHAEMLMRMYLE